MISTRPLRQHAVSTADQILSIITQNKAFDTNLASSIINTPTNNIVDTVSNVLQSIPKFFFQSTPIDRHRHRRRHKQEEPNKIHGPSAHHIDPNKVEFGLSKALEFFYWVETELGFIHNEKTCRKMACLLAKATKMSHLWYFLEEMLKRENKNLITTETITCLIKILAENGSIDQALSIFTQMKKLNCKPDVCVYNTMIYVLCKHGIMQTGCRQVIRKRLSDVNQLFRTMIHKGFVPNLVTYNCVIECCCKGVMIEWAVELFDDMKKRGCNPNWVTYNCLIRYYSRFDEIDKAIHMLRLMQEDDGHDEASLAMAMTMTMTMIYTPIIHGLCKVGRLLDARNFLVELVNSGCVPREDTFKLVSDLLDEVCEPELLDNEMRRKIRDGIENRYKKTCFESEVDYNSSTQCV